MTHFHLMRTQKHLHLGRIPKFRCFFDWKASLTNFDDYEAFEEVTDEGQEILGTRFVLTEKPDHTIKARFVTKGFQEKFSDQSDSPTASRESVKIFLAIAANEKWVVESSDVRSSSVRNNRPCGVC